MSRSPTTDRRPPTRCADAHIAHRVARARRRVAADHVWDGIFGFVLLFGFLALYARTAAPGVLDGDFGEFQTNIYRLGVSHTGYPLYFLLAKLWTLLIPVGTIAFRANVFSGFCGALTLVLLYGLMRTLTAHRVVALAMAMLFGVSRVQWSQAVVPDVYTLNSFFIVLVLWLAVRWRIGNAPMWAMLLAYGFSLTHHRTMIWLAPALALFVWLGAGRPGLPAWRHASRETRGRMRVGAPPARRRAHCPSSRVLRVGALPLRAWAKNAAALLLPLLLYVYIPLRGESDVGVEYHAAGFDEMILATNASLWLRFGPPAFLWERITQVYLPLLIEQFTPIGFAFGLVGIATLAFARVPRGFPATLSARHLLLLVGLAHLAETAFAIVFWVLDSEIFFIPSYLTFLVFVGLGLAHALDAITTDAPTRLLGRMGNALTLPRSNVLALWHRIAHWVFGGGMFALCAFLLFTNFARNDQSRNDEADVRWREILAQPLEEHAVIIGPWEDLTPLEYFQYVENVRPDLERRKVVIYQDQLKLVSQKDVPKEVRQLQKKGRAVYFTRHPLQTETLHKLARLPLAAIASLWRIGNRAETRPMEHDAWFGEILRLKAVTIIPDAPRAGDFLAVYPVWDMPEGKSLSFKTLLRLRDRNGVEWARSETEPFAGMDATTVARAPQDAFNGRGLFIPPDAPPGEYTLELAVYDETNQPLLNRGAETAPLLTFHLFAPVHPHPNVLTFPRSNVLTFPLAASDGTQLVAYALSASEPRGGDEIELATWWQGVKRGDESFVIMLRDAKGIETTLYQGSLLPFAEGEFNPDQIVRARHRLILPPTAATGFAQLVMRLDGQNLPPLRLALHPSHRLFYPPTIPHRQTARLGDAIQFLGYRLDRRQAQRGEWLHLTLFWKAQAMPSESYKVFVHLLDANGVLRAQDDAYPRRGALPTDRWFPGEYIADEYSLPIGADLAAGEYRIEAGMYIPSTGARVPLWDAGGVRLPQDRILLDDVIVIR